MMLKTVVILTVATIAQAWIRFRLPGDYSDDDYLDSRDRLFRPFVGETLLERIIRAREQLELIKSRDSSGSSAHADDPFDSLEAVPVALKVRSFGFADVVEMIFIAIVVLSMVSAGYIIKSRYEELVTIKGIAAPQNPGYLNAHIYGTVDQSVKRSNVDEGV